MVEFKVITTPKPDRFEETVTNMLNDGWELQGSVFVSSVGAMTAALTRTKKAAATQKATAIKKKVA